MSVLHVVPDVRGSWKVVGETTDADLDTGDLRTTCQADAVNQACVELSLHDGGEVVIHNLRGRVQDKRTIQPG